MVEAERIKNRLRLCLTRREVNEVANDEREAVKSLAASADTKVMAIQIANLKNYKLKMLQE